MGFGESWEAREKKNRYRGEHPKNMREKGGSGETEYFSKTLKWHNVFILKKNKMNKLTSSSSTPAACAGVTNAFSQSVLFRVHEGVSIVSGFLNLVPGVLVPLGTWLWLPA